MEIIFPIGCITQGKNKLMAQIFREIKKPTDSLLEYYRNQFIRNQSKWIRLSKLTPDHLDTEFKIGKTKYWLRGSINPTEFIIEEVDKSKFFIVDSPRVNNIILKIDQS